MVDAALLAMPDAMGGTLWHPSSIEDVYELPDRVLSLYTAYRAGMAHAARKGSGQGKQGSIGGVKVG